MSVSVVANDGMYDLKGLAGLISTIIGRDIDIEELVAEEKHDLGKITPVKMRADDPRIIAGSPAAAKVIDPCKKATEKISKFEEDFLERLTQQRDECYLEAKKLTARVEELETKLSLAYEEIDSLQKRLRAVREAISDLD